MARFSDDPDILQAALVGFEVQKQKIEAKIGELKAQLRGKPAASGPAPAVAPAHAKKGGRRVLSDAARERIAAAQRKRWADFHKQKSAAE